MEILGGPGGGIPDVPDVSARWYVDVVAAVAGLPSPVVAVIAALPSALLLVLALVSGAAWWSARRADVTVMARVLAVPVVALAAYGTSELVKQVWHVERPCRLIAGVVTAERCPAPGDWSFPSNHATVAAALAVAVWWAGRRLGVPAVAVAVLEACSRVLVGAHFPHDVMVGLALGGSVALSAPLAARCLRPAVVRLRASRFRWVAAGRDESAAPTTPLVLRN